MYAIRSYYALRSSTQNSKSPESLIDQNPENNTKVDLKKQTQTQIQDVSITVTDSVITSYSIHYTKLYD